MKYNIFFIIKDINKNLSTIVYQSKYRKIIIPFLFFVSYILFYFLIDFSSQSLVVHDEGLYARRARLVAESDNWFSPPFSTPHHKTIGSYWLIALSIKLLGNGELAVRLPSILISFICLLLCFIIAKKIFNREIAIISLLSLSAMPLWIQYSRYSSPDITFVMFVLFVILFFINFIETVDPNKKNIFIFLAGFFSSIAFFIRSYMIIIPLIGLSPFILFNLWNSKYKYKFLFLSGLLSGLLPTFLNIFYAYLKHGDEGVSLLFEFAKNQAIGEFNISNLLLLPLNYFYLTFPIGLIFILLFILNKPKYLPKFPLLVYYYPLISFVLLVCMSKFYPHYFLFLLPSLAILLSHLIDSYSSNYFIQNKKINFILILVLSLLIFSLSILCVYYKPTLIEFSVIQVFIINSVLVTLIISYISSIVFIHRSKLIKTLDFKMLLIILIIPQYISLSLLYNFGIIGNPNLKIKKFLANNNVSSIITSNTIYLYDLDSKTETLLSFYLPSSIVVNSFDDLVLDNFVITSKNNNLTSLSEIYRFKSISNSDNKFLLIKIRK